MIPRSGIKTPFYEDNSRKFQNWLTWVLFLFFAIPFAACLYFNFEDYGKIEASNE